MVYLKVVAFDNEDHPVILYELSKGFDPGPKNDPRQWKTARWTGKTWEILDFATSNHNYDFGSLYIDPGGEWRIIATTAQGPQEKMTGGDLVLWTSSDQGHSWTKVRQITHAAKMNPSYPRKPVNAQPAFYALWADGDAHLPARMEKDFEKPKRVR